MSLLGRSGQLQCTFLIILHPLSLNTKGGAVNIIEQRGACRCFFLFLISVLPPEFCLSQSQINATVCEL